MHLWFQKQIVRHCAVQRHRYSLNAFIFHCRTLKYRYLHRPHKRPNLHPSGQSNGRTIFLLYKCFYRTERDILPGIIAQKMGEKAVGKLFRLVPEKKGHHKMANHVETDSPFAPPVEGKRRGLFLITDIYFRTVFSASPISAAANGFHACGFPEQRILIRSPFTTGK